MLIVYRGESEVLVTTAENEAKMVQEWITEGQRVKEDYDRFAIPKDVVQVRSAGLAIRD